jgi:hypothetical protein
MIPILQLDIAGNPSAWITHREAITLTSMDQVIANLGQDEVTFKGGTNRLSGLQSEITVGSILLTRQKVNRKIHAATYVPPLTNKALFKRDGHQCLYCGETFPEKLLTRDHIMPSSRGGRDSWVNCVTACFSCNNRKGNRTPEEWGTLLLAVPFIPNHAEYLYIKNHHRIIADQQAFLASRFRNLQWS